MSLHLLLYYNVMAELFTFEGDVHVPGPHQRSQFAVDEAEAYLFVSGLRTVTFGDPSEPKLLETTTTNVNATTVSAFTIARNPLKSLCLVSSGRLISAVARINEGTGGSRVSTTAVTELPEWYQTGYNPSIFSQALEVVPYAEGCLVVGTNSGGIVYVDPLHSIATVLDVSCMRSNRHRGAVMIGNVLFVLGYALYIYEVNNKGVFLKDTFKPYGTRWMSISKYNGGLLLCSWDGFLVLSVDGTVLTTVVEYQTLESEGTVHCEGHAGVVYMLQLLETNIFSIDAAAFDGDEKKIVAVSATPEPHRLGEHHSSEVIVDFTIRSTLIILLHADSVAFFSLNASDTVEGVSNQTELNIVAPVLFLSRELVPQVTAAFSLIPTFTGRLVLTEVKDNDKPLVGDEKAILSANMGGNNVYAIDFSGSPLLSNAIPVTLPKDSPQADIYDLSPITLESTSERGVCVLTRTLDMSNIEVSHTLQIVPLGISFELGVSNDRFHYPRLWVVGRFCYVFSEDGKPTLRRFDALSMVNVSLSVPEGLQGGSGIVAGSDAGFLSSLFSVTEAEAQQLVFLGGAHGEVFVYRLNGEADEYLTSLHIAGENYTIWDLSVGSGVINAVVFHETTLRTLFISCTVASMSPICKTVDLVGRTPDSQAEYHRNQRLNVEARLQVSGGFAYVASPDFMIVVIDIVAMKVVRKGIGPEDMVYDIALTSDGRKLVALGTSGTVAFYALGDDGSPEPSSEPSEGPSDPIGSGEMRADPSVAPSMETAVPEVVDMPEREAEGSDAGGGDGGGGRSLNSLGVMLPSLAVCVVCLATVLCQARARQRRQRKLKGDTETETPLNSEELVEGEKPGASDFL